VTPSARILVVGTELLGRKADANGPVVAKALARRGYLVRGIAIVPDDLDELAARFSDAMRECSLVVALGGLGPTADDLTREALSRATGIGIVEHEVSRERIVARFAGRGRVPTELSLRQALVPEGSDVVANVTGAAPGSVLMHAGTVVVLLPGPPSEIAGMLDPALDRATLRLSEIGLAPGLAPSRGQLVLAGIGESDAAMRVASLPALQCVNVAWLPRSGEVCVHFWGEAPAVAAALTVARAELAVHVVSDDGRRLAQVIVEALTSREETLAAAESCTGGLVSADLTSVPGSSAIVRAGVVAYANEAKTSILAVAPSVLAEHGAVSEPVALAMAVGIRRVASADWGIGVTGIAGPAGGTADKPVGLVWIAIAAPDGRKPCERHVFGGSRDDIRQQAVAAALDLVRRSL
jgi:nicotinamide-nucleotide amidase